MTQPNLSHLALSDNGFLFDSSTGRTYTLNSTGTFILKKLIDGLSRKDILSALVEEYDVTEITASHDLDKFLDYLSELLSLDDLLNEGEKGNEDQEA